MAEMTDLEILESLDSEVCAACGRKKKSRMSHCRTCYYQLPPEMRKALYRRFDHGYQEAFRASLELLQN
jgi:predicted amidophosphoribosyltransferase